MKIYNNPEEGNELISTILDSQKQFSVARIGIGEFRIIYHSYIMGVDLEQYINLAKYNGGVYGDSYKDFISEYVESIKKSSIHCYWKMDDSNINKVQNEIFEKLSPETTKIPHRSIEPYFFDNPWTLKLEGKRVLVISPFINTINYQYKRKNKIWDKRQILPDFDLQTYKSVQSLGNVGPHSSWSESLKTMKEEISKLEFDVALLSCGTYGLPLSTFISEDLKKGSIYIGGALQILFGIRGRRWDDHPDFQEFYNSSWKRPFDDEKPTNYNQIEGGCYW